MEDRKVIHNINKGGFGQAEIGQSTVSKKLSRNKGQRGYRSKQADDLAKERQELKRALPTSPRKPGEKNALTHITYDGVNQVALTWRSLPGVPVNQQRFFLRIIEVAR